MKLWRAIDTFYISEYDAFSPEDDFQKISKYEIIGELESSVGSYVKLRVISQEIPANAYPHLLYIMTVPDPASPIGQGVSVRDETSDTFIANDLTFTGDVVVTETGTGKVEIHITGGSVVQDTYMITQPILSIDSGLDAFHTAGSWKFDSNDYSIAEGTYTLLDDKTDWYIYVQGDNLLHQAATVPSGTIGIAKYTTTGGAITQLTNLGALAIQAHVDNLADKVGEDDATAKTATTPDYASNNFIDDGDNHNIALGKLDDILGVIAPSKAGLLTSTDLVTSGTTKYTAKLPGGLNAAWYQGGASAGSTITSYVVDGSYVLTSSDSSTRFRCGRAGITSTYGDLIHVLDAVDADTHDMTTGTGTTGTVTCNSIATYNSLWAKGNGYITYNQTIQGYKSHALKHTEAGTTNTAPFWFDDVATAPSFSASPSVAENTVNSKWLSGVEYYGLNSTLDVSYIAASGIFTKAYHPTEVSRIECIGAPNNAVNPSVTPDVSDNFVVTNHTITLSVSNQSTMTKQLTVRLYKPDGQTTNQTAALSKAICTYGTASTTTAEYFYDEAQRIYTGGGAWDSTVALINGEAQVRNGDLEYGITDYPAKTGDQEYYRRFYKTAASNGSLTFTGINYTDVSAYSTGNLNMFLYLETDNLWFDLGRPFGSNNGTGSGDSRANSKGARVSGSGSLLNWTIGTNSTAYNSNRYRIVIVFINTTNTINSIVSA